MKRRCQAYIEFLREEQVRGGGSASPHPKPPRVERTNLLESTFTVVAPKAALVKGVPIGSNGLERVRCLSADSTLSTHRLILLLSSRTKPTNPEQHVFTERTIVPCQFFQGNGEWGGLQREKIDWQEAQKFDCRLVRTIFIFCCPSVNF